MIESGQRIHLTEYEWPKNDAPSGFSMKLRKHLKKKHLNEIRQVGFDRTVDLKFGSGDQAYHILVELYNKGNMLLTDFEYKILHLLRPRIDYTTATKIATNELYSFENIRYLPKSFESLQDLVDEIFQEINKIKSKTSENEDLIKQLSHSYPIGTEVLDHACKKAGLTKKRIFDSSDEELKIISKNIALEIIELTSSSKFDQQMIPVIIGKPSLDDKSQIDFYESFHPMLFEQLRCRAYKEFPSYNSAIDDYFTNIESRKNNQEINQKEKKAYKKLQNIERDHDNRINQLSSEQQRFSHLASLIELNKDLVDRTILLINRYLANQLDWECIKTYVKEATLEGDPLASSIVELNLSNNQMTLCLEDPFSDSDYSDEENDEDNEEDENKPKNSKKERFAQVLIDLGVNAMVNASQLVFINVFKQIYNSYYNKRKAANQKIEKTMLASSKAIKSASKLTNKALKDIQTVKQITKVRKNAWFEKFHWFISSENYLIVAGRDAQQNDMLYKRYFNSSDIYVHADVHGASTVIVKARKLQPGEYLPDNDSYVSSNGLPQPPLKSLNEAGYMALALSSAWNSSVITSAWWVYHHQVSKTAPSGQYIGTGSFIIRGQKNYLQPSQLVYGFGIMFKLDSDCVDAHRNDRRIKSETSDNIRKTFETGISKNIPDLKENSDSEKDDINDFPQVDLKIDFTEKNKKKIYFASDSDPLKRQDSNEQYSLIQTPGARFNLKNQPNKPNIRPQIVEERKKNENTGLTRGQKGKYKKIKQKYKDQDDIERELRIKLLQGPNAQLSRCHDIMESAKIKVPSNIEERSLNERVDEEENVCLTEKSSSMMEDNKSDSENSEEKAEISDQKDAQEEKDASESEEEDNEKEIEKDSTQADELIEILDSLTGQPSNEDTILYAVPVSAPYSCMQNFKFKVKLTPGFKKRGKAAKQALEIFLQNRFATDRQKCLIRVIKDEEMSKNMLASVKIHNPQPHAPVVPKSQRSNRQQN